MLDQAKIIGGLGGNCNWVDEAFDDQAAFEDSGFPKIPEGSVYTADCSSTGSGFATIQEKTGQALIANSDGSVDFYQDPLASFDLQSYPSASGRRLGIYSPDFISKIRDQICHSPNMFIERMEVQGNPSWGKIIFLRNHHPTSQQFFNDTLSFGEKITNINDLYAYQWQVLRWLFHTQPKHLFIEGVTEKNIDDYRQSLTQLSESEKSRYRELFSASQLNDPIMNMSQRFFLNLKKTHRFEAQDIYLTLHPEAQFYSAESHQLNQEAIQLLDKLSQTGDDEGFDEAVHLKRDAYAVQILQEFFQHNPGATVVLFFGGMHEFADDLQTLSEAERPSLISVEWPLVPMTSKSAESEYEKMRRNRYPDLFESK